MTTRSMNPEFTINGDYGSLYDTDGNFVSSVQEVQGRIRINREEIMRSGTRITGYKAMGVTGEGSIRRFKVTSEWISLFKNPFDDGDPVAVGQMIVKLADPASLGTERLLLKSVKFWEIDFGWRVGQLVEENIDFTFEGFDPLDELTGDPTITASRFSTASGGGTGTTTAGAGGGG